MEQRTHVREEYRSQQQLLSLNEKNRLIKSLVLSRNISASGMRFRSAQPLHKGDIFLIRLDHQLEALEKNTADVIKMGDFFMTCAVWSRVSEIQNDPFFEVGCRFLKRREAQWHRIDQLTNIINRLTLEQLIYT